MAVAVHCRSELAADVLLVLIINIIATAATAAAAAATATAARLADGVNFCATFIQLRKWIVARDVILASVRQKNGLGAPGSHVDYGEGDSTPAAAAVAFCFCRRLLAPTRRDNSSHPGGWTAAGRTPDLDGGRQPGKSIRKKRRWTGSAPLSNCRRTYGHAAYGRTCDGGARPWRRLRCTLQPLALWVVHCTCLLYRLYRSVDVQDAHECRSETTA